MLHHADYIEALKLVEELVAEPLWWIRYDFNAGTAMCEYCSVTVQAKLKIPHTNACPVGRALKLLKKLEA